MNSGLKVNFAPKKTFTYPVKKLTYSSSFIGGKNIIGDGKFVRISILDTGLPNHFDIATDSDKSANFSRSGSIYDVNGHSTAVAGILASSGKSGIKGVVSSADLFFCKVADDNGVAEYKSVEQGVLWSITREVDIIVIAMGSDFDYPGMYNAIKKAYKLGILVFAASGNMFHRTKDSVYPARYNEVFSVGFNKNINNLYTIQSNSHTKGVVVEDLLYSTLIDENKYTVVRGSSMATGVVAGVAAQVFQKLRREGKDIKNPQLTYNEIGRILNKD